MSKIFNNMTDLTKLTLAEAKDKLERKEFSSVELTQAFIEKIEKEDLNSFITKTPDIALKLAKESDERRHKGINLKMDGLPIAIKDLFCTKNIRTTAGSKMLENFIPPYESTVTKNLLDEGAVFLGKTNMDEFAMGSANTTSYFGSVKSPIKSTKYPDRTYIPGGSSGGSAAAVKADFCLAATGSDTGGSIRQPAAFCGVVGIKPTYGMCSRYGMVAFASSLDQAGPITKTVEDAALMLSVMAGYDENDSTSAKIEKPNYTITQNVKGKKIGIPKEYIENLSKEAGDNLQRGIDVLTNNGASIHEISLEMTPHALPVYYIIAPAEASSNLARYDGIRYGYRTKDYKNLHELYEKTRSEGFGAEVKRRILIGTYVLSSGYYDAYYIRAQKIRKKIKNDFNNAFKKVDFILTPTTPSGAFAIDNMPKDPITMYLNDIFTVTVNLAGLPAISVPFGKNDENMPLGLQLIGKAFFESDLFNAASVLEKYN